MKLTTWLVVAGLAATAVPATAATSWLGVNGGVGLPTGNFADAASIGLGVGASLDARVAPLWTVGGEVGWMHFGGDEDFEDALSGIAGENVDVTFNVVPIQAVAKLILTEGASTTPYLRGGFGAYMIHTKFDGETFNADDDATDLGFNLGAGFVSTGRGDPHVGGELNYHYIATEGDATNLFTIRAVVLFGMGGR